MTKRIGIIGNGNVGSALARGLERAGNEVRAVGNDEVAIADVANWAEVVVVAIPFGAIDDFVRVAGQQLADKTVVDVTNTLTSDMSLAVGFTTSGAEELQRKLPNAHIVKAFNTVFAEHMDTGRVGDHPLTAFVASDYPDAKETVFALANGIGFDAVDAGPLKNARQLEPMAYLIIQLGYVLGMGSQIGFRLLHSRKPGSQ